MIYSDGSTLKALENNEKQGNGILVYPDESYMKAIGKMISAGFGKLITVDGVILEGEWKNGKINGIGKLIQSNGEI